MAGWRVLSVCSLQAFGKRIAVTGTGLIWEKFSDGFEGLKV